MIRSVIFLLACVVLPFTGCSAEASASVAIQPIEEAKLDELINAGDGRLVVTFVAAWCPPCIDELPILNKLYTSTKTGASS